MSLSRKLMSLANVQTLPSDIKKFKPEVHLHILAKWSDPEIEAFANALIDTYVIAQEWGDTKMEAAAEQALLEIGRYLAKRIGPNAVGYL
ncbi:hypothetical protein ACFZ8E_26685 [Methylobacterium sp. HMF5984]|uniref:hypothetical protein n=1 Tax=Methylobacterium sp. HMF5984 TaxID=3367370 RepID=UPI003853AF99